MSPKTMFPLLVLALLAAAAAASVTAAARDIPDRVELGRDLAARLEASGGLVECWNALMEIKSCSNEIVLFFLNGQADLGPQCCQAIDVITHNCWPAMLTSLGFTAEEGNVLRGYCDASSSGGGRGGSGSGSGPAAAPTAAHGPVSA